MKFPQIFATLSLGLFFWAAPQVYAAVGVSSSELQASSSLVMPNGDRVDLLSGYSPFVLKNRSGLTGGISALYEARLLTDPRVEEELPQLQLLIFSYATQEDALSAFKNLSDKLSDRTILSSDSRSFLFRSEGGENVDSFSTLDAEYHSFHLLHANGNLIYQVSLFREDGTFNEKNLKTYTKAIENLSQVKAILYDLLETSKGMMGILFPPTDGQVHLSGESFSEALENAPSHGTIDLDVYISDPSGAVGTLLDSSGLSTPAAGDLYLYLHADGRIFGGIYAPVFDADCPQESGWYRLESSAHLNPYEWNRVSLHYGVSGFSLELNYEEEGSCRVAQARSDRPLYLGDYPNDSLAESALGYVKNLSSTASLTDDGRYWDQVLKDQLFLDLPNSDPDVPVFLYLKEQGIFLGSDGMLYPDAILNRAEMVKILLRAFDKTVAEGGVPFWDVPSDAWYGKYLATAYKLGMIKGHDNGSFLPGHPINRAEFFTMLDRLDSSKLDASKNGHAAFLDVEEGVWYESAADYASSKGLIGGLFFLGEQELSRREAAQYLYALLK